MILSFRLPWPPSVNHYWRNVGGRVLISSSGRAYKQLVARLVPRSEAPFTCHVAVRLDAYQPDRRRRDADNILKAVLDSLTGCGLWHDDSQVYDLRVRKWPMPADDADRGVVRVTILVGDDMPADTPVDG